ncbi:MAG: tetratricopeptide repeat protein [Acetobacteraceae bacterium]|nr:tetratricopeptide repeat protein [Acetobacteraceae bacterium]
MPDRFAPLDESARNELRQIAHDCYARGDLAEAMSVQRKTMAAGPATADDSLFLALLLFAAQDLAGGTEVLREGLSQFPGDPSLHENLGVFLMTAGDSDGAVAACRQALTLGSSSPNVHDCLCEALNQLGHSTEAVQAGRAALEAKDRMFGERAPVVDLPPGPPPPFDTGDPAANVIAYSLWGNQPRYLVPLAENIRILPHLFPGWSIRVYYDTTVDHEFIANLGRQGVQSRQMILPPGQPGHRRLLWRFEVIHDPSVKRFLVRDADAILTVKERVAVDAWCQSDSWFHTMRDWYTHTDLILAGMWGGIGGILPSPTDLFRHWTAWRMENNHIDQDILSDTVWPTVRRSLLIHDSVFTGTLGSVPFPPYGDLPAGHHIGQNSFAHFEPAGQITP